MHPEVQDEARAAFASSIQTDPESGRVLTDNFNPAEYFDARNREEFRRRMASFVRLF
jgi:hypothetical protein